jgi:hypothetical protein
MKSEYEGARRWGGHLRAFEVGLKLDLESLFALLPVAWAELI